MSAIKSKKGFSLVELSVVLTIIGATLSGALSLAIQKTESDRIEETEEKIEKINDAIELFLIQNQRIPCPANPAAVHNATDFGVEGAPSDDDSNSICTFTNSTTTAAASNLYAGSLPVRPRTGTTTGMHLPYDIMFDGWGRRFTYVVDARFANNESTNTSTNCSTDNLCFKNAATGAISLDGDTSYVYLIISHGKNGSGAYTYYGSTTRLSASADTEELENAFDDEGAFDADFVSYSTGSVFDDYVDGRTKDQLITNSNALDDSDVCDLVDSSSAPDNICDTGITDQTKCEAWVTKISNICFNP